MIAASGSAATLARLRLEARAAQETYEALYDGDLTWQDFRPEMTCGDRQQAAIDEAWQEAREAQDTLDRALADDLAAQL